MTRYSLRMTAAQRAKLESLIFKDEKEAAALALCGRSSVPDLFGGGIDERFLVHEIIEVPETAYYERSKSEFTWSTTPFYEALIRAEAKDFAVAVFHSHPEGCTEFSAKDDLSDREIFEVAFNRLESRKRHLSAIIERSGFIKARCYGPDLNPTAVDHIATIGDEWQFLSPESANLSAAMDRQVRAFGSASTRTLGQISIGIVGCGGTGSAVAALLSRAGARKVILMDRDRVEETNLNRLHFSSRSDAILEKSKVDVVAEGMAEAGIIGSVVRIRAWADEEEGLLALRGCDIIFGCTDDHLGREVLNRIAHYYLIPVIDLGLLIRPAEVDGYETFDGRVTVVQPGNVCQRCRGLINSEDLYQETLRRDTVLYEERRRAGYVPDRPDPSPVVITFATEVACMAVNEMFHRLNKFRGDENCSERVRQFQFLKDADVLPAGKARSGCKLCDRRLYDGRGDAEPLIDLVL